MNQEIVPQNEAIKTLNQWKFDLNVSTFKELASVLGVAQNTLDTWKARGKIPNSAFFKYGMLTTNKSDVLVFEDDSDCVITLKEITDLINVRHNDAMAKIESLSKEASFGALRKIRIATIQTNGKANNYIDTYNLNKKQAIAAGAKLNDTLLMVVIDRVEQLEQNKNNSISHIDDENIRLLARGQVRISDRMDNIEDKFSSLQESLPIDHWQQKELLRIKSKKVYSFKPKNQTEQSALERKIGHIFKKRFQLPRYDALPRKLYEEATQFLEDFTPAQLAY